MDQRAGKMTRALIASLLSFCFVCGASAQDNFAFDFDHPSAETPLPSALLEISGLAAGPDNTVYAHNDEYAIVYRLDLRDGSIVSAFALGKPTAQADFEAIASAGNRIYLMTSAGLLYEALIKDHGERSHFNVYDTGLHTECEVEGLATGPGPGEFLILCKRAIDKKLEGRLVIYKWSLADRLPVGKPWIDLPLKDFLKSAEREHFRPSALEWRAADKRLIILSARNHMILTMSETGALLSKAELSPTVHLQAEGVAILPDGRLVIADEGAARKYGQLTVYNPK